MSYLEILNSAGEWLIYRVVIHKSTNVEGFEKVRDAELSKRKKMRRGNGRNHFRWRRWWQFYKFRRRYLWDQYEWNIWFWRGKENNVAWCANTEGTRLHSPCHDTNADESLQAGVCWTEVSALVRDIWKEVQENTAGHRLFLCIRLFSNAQRYRNLVCYAMKCCYLHVKDDVDEVFLLKGSK